jgi:colicin import membrane protein
MKLPSGKRSGKSEHELARAVFVSFFLHAAIVFVALFLHFSVFPKTVLPPAYQVKLVGPPKELVETSAPPKNELVPTPEAAPPKKEIMPAAAKPSPMPKKAAAELKKSAPKKEASPGPGHLKQKSAPLAQTKANETVPKESTAVPSAPVAPAGVSLAAGKQSEGVVVSSSSHDSKLAPYFRIITNRIEMNWNPTPGVKGVKVKVTFRVLRSGRVFGDAIIEQSSGNVYFDLAAKRAILSSSPFPPMPDDFYKDYAELTVDFIPVE